MTAAFLWVLLVVGGAGSILAAVAYAHMRGYSIGVQDAVRDAERRAAERLARQNEIAKRPISDADLERSLKDGTF